MVTRVKTNEPVLYGFDPLLGFWGTPNIEEEIIYKEFGNKVVGIQQNACGNRDISYKPNGHLKSVVCLGGSHTWGGGIEAKFRYSNILREKIENPVINAGHCSLGLDQECLYILEKIKKYNPKVIIVEQYPWGVTRILNNYVNGYIKPKFSLSKDGGLKLKKVPKYARFKFIRKILGAFYAYKKELDEFRGGIDLKTNYRPLEDPIFMHWKYNHYDYMYALVEQLAVVMRDHCKQENIHLIFALGAVLQQFEGSSPSELVDYDLPRKRLKTILKRIGVEYVDMSNAMLKAHSAQDPVIFYDGHINEKGNRIFADVLQHEMKKRDWVCMKA